MAYIFKSFVYLSSLKISLQKAVILMVWINNCILEFHCCSCFTRGSPVSWACFGYNSIYVATGLLSVFKSDSKTLGLQGAVRRLFAYRKCNFFLGKQIPDSMKIRVKKKQGQKQIIPWKRTIFSNKKDLHKGQLQPENGKPLYMKNSCPNFKPHASLLSYSTDCLGITVFVSNNYFI